MVEKAGLNEEQAAKAIDTMKEYVKSKLPPMIAGNVDAWFTGMAASKPQTDDFLD